MAKDTKDGKNTDKSGQSSRIPLADKMRNLRNGMKMRTYEEITEDRGGPVETTEVESAGQVVARYVHKDGKLVESAATTDAQNAGDHQKAAQKLGNKEDDLTYTGTDMVMAQSATREHNSAPEASDSAQPRGEKEEKRTDPRESEAAALAGNKKKPKESQKLEKAEDDDWDPRRPGGIGTKPPKKRVGKISVARTPKEARSIADDILASDAKRKPRAPKKTGAAGAPVFNDIEAQRAKAKQMVGSDTVDERKQRVAASLSKINVLMSQLAEKRSDRQPAAQPQQTDKPGQWDVLGRRKKPVEPGGSQQKIRRALEAQKDTNPYAESAHTVLREPLRPRDPKYAKALETQRSGTKPDEPEKRTPVKSTKPSHLKVVKSLAKSEGRDNMDRLLQTIRMHLKNRPAGGQPPKLDDRFKERLAHITQQKDPHQQYAKQVAQEVREMAAKPKVEVQPHPEEVANVDPKVLANMKQRLENTNKSAQPIADTQESALAKHDPVDHVKHWHDTDLDHMIEVMIEEKLKRRNAHKPGERLGKSEPLTKDEPEQVEKVKHRSYRLLTDEASNAKTAKNAKRGQFLSSILHLAPATLAGCGNLCPASSEGCRQACLNTAGRGGIFKDPAEAIIQNARIARTKMLYKEPEKFWKNLTLDIEKVKKQAAAENRKPVVRLNGTSDIAWEDLKPHELGGKNVFEAHPDVQFYDYTKRPDRVMRNKHPNYHLTFSRSEDNENVAKRLLRNGHNVAVVFGGKQLPGQYLGAPVVSGDEHDLRFLDPRDKGHVIGLKAKGDAKHDTSGFVVWGHEGDPTAQPKRPKETKYSTLMSGQKLGKSESSMNHLDKDDKPHPAGSPEAAAHEVVEHDASIKSELKALGTPDKMKRMLQHLRTRKPGDKSWERSPANHAVGHMEKSGLGDAIASSVGGAMAGTVGDPTGGGAMGAGGQGVPQVNKSAKPPLKKAEGSVASRYINPKLLSTEPTHTFNGLKVKHLHTVDTNRGPVHVVEHMEGKNKGKWTQAHDNDLKPLKKADGLMGAANPFYKGPAAPAPAPTPPPSTSPSGSGMIQSINAAGAKTQAGGGNAEAAGTRLKKSVDAKEEWHKLSEKLQRDPTDEEFRDHIADIHSAGHDAAEAHMEELRMRHHAIKAKNAEKLGKKYEGFAAVEESAKESGARDPAAVAAAAGRKKYGAKAMAEAAAHHHKLGKAEPLSKDRIIEGNKAVNEWVQHAAWGPKGKPKNFKPKPPGHGMDPELLKEIAKVAREERAHRLGHPTPKEEVKKAEGAPAAPRPPVSPRPTPTLKIKKPKKPHPTGQVSVVAGSAAAPMASAGATGALGKADELEKKQGVAKGVDPAKHERCVMDVKEKGGSKNPWAVCNAALQKMRKSCKSMKKAQGAPPSF